MYSTYEIDTVIEEIAAIAKIINTQHNPKAHNHLTSNPCGVNAIIP